MPSYHYAHIDTDRLVTSLRPEGRIFVAENADSRSIERATRVALMSLSIAKRLGIATPAHGSSTHLPYSESSDAISFPAPELSKLLGRTTFFLRGWKQFQSCIKGFNALGLMADHVLEWTDEFHGLEPADQFNRFSKFLAAKKITPTSNNQDLDVNLLDLAIWHCFSNRTIVCSTSSNMGVSLHEILRLMQNTRGEVNGHSYRILDSNEGHLIIWCPDERADFMNAEKAQLLRRLEKEEPKLTTLRTYINRQQRDPGALGDALQFGGYFFPTNPQSAQELQNLLFGALLSDQSDPAKAVRELLQDRSATVTLRSLGCVVNEDLENIAVQKGVEGGIHGLMIPFWILLEELAEFQQLQQLEIWNQASIGAALAAAVLAEEIVSSFSELGDSTKELFRAHFPRLSALLSEPDRRRSRRRIVGVFDIANLQSLAQLLGVVVPNHTAGRSTAFVGLGSSSYSNGNRCFEILDTAVTKQGAFRGREDFLPSTHTLSPVAQALIVGEELQRGALVEHNSILNPSRAVEITRKPEPAGAAALAGVLLNMLDTGTLTVFEIADQLHRLGFNASRFLHLHFGRYVVHESEQQFLQDAFEEGPYMGQFAADLLSLLNWPASTLTQYAQKQRSYRESTVPPDSSCASALVVYLTGDNCAQPSVDFLNEVLGASSLQSAHD